MTTFVQLRSMGYRAPWEVADRKRFMIGTEGVSDSGKTEFLLSAPPPIGIICIDRNYEMTFNNPNPPKERANIKDQVLVKIIDIPAGNELSASQEVFQEYWRMYRDSSYELAGVSDIGTICLDGDSDSWQVQRLAAYGKLKGVPQMNYDTVYASRRTFIAKLHDSNKNVICTNKLKDEWVPEIGPDGQPVLADSGQVKKKKSGNLERQGFPDDNYLYHIQLRHLYKIRPDRVIAKGPRAGETIPGGIDYGIKILKCKPRMELMGQELWGDQCNYKGLVRLVFPNDSMKLWGYPTDD